MRATLRELFQGLTHDIRNKSLLKARLTGSKITETHKVICDFCKLGVLWKVENKNDFVHL